MPPKRRRRFQGLYYHSSPPKVLPMNGQLPNDSGRRRRGSDDFSIKLSTIRIWMHEKEIGKLTRILWAGQGNRLRQQASTNPRVKRFLAAVPYVMNSIRDVHQAVIDNNLENLQAHLEPPVPPALVTCRDANGLNLIHKAAGLGHATILEYLITTWPDGVHECDITGKTPLHWAASAKNNMRCYTLLTQAGCDEEAVDYKMKTPSFYRHKPHEIERAFLTYVPEAPRVSPDVATDWEALSDDSGDGKNPNIKIPEMNGFGRHSNTESNENTSEAEMTEGASAADDDDAGGGDDEALTEEPEKEEEPAAEENGDGDAEPAADEEEEQAEEEKPAEDETEDKKEEENAEETENANEEAQTNDDEATAEDKEEPQDEKQTQSVNETNATTTTNDSETNKAEEEDHEGENEKQNDEEESENSKETVIEKSDEGAQEREDNEKEVNEKDEKTIETAEEIKEIEEKQVETEDSDKSEKKKEDDEDLESHDKEKEKDEVVESHDKAKEEKEDLESHDKGKEEEEDLESHDKGKEEKKDLESHDKGKEEEEDLESHDKGKTEEKSEDQVKENEQDSSKEAETKEDENEANDKANEVELNGNNKGEHNEEKGDSIKEGDNEGKGDGKDVVKDMEDRDDLTKNDHEKDSLEEGNQENNKNNEKDEKNETVENTSKNNEKEDDNKDKENDDQTQGKNGESKTEGKHEESSIKEETEISVDSGKEDGNISKNKEDSAKEDVNSTKEETITEVEKEKKKENETNGKPAENENVPDVGSNKSSENGKDEEQVPKTDDNQKDIKIIEEKSENAEEEIKKEKLGTNESFVKLNLVPTGILKEDHKETSMSDEKKKTEEQEEDENNNNAVSPINNEEKDDQDPNRSSESPQKSPKSPSDTDESQDIEDFLKQTQQDISNKFDEISDNLKENVKEFSNKIKNIFTTSDENENDDKRDGEEREDNDTPKDSNENESNDIVVGNANTPKSQHKVVNGKGSGRKSGKHRSGGENSSEDDDDEDDEESRINRIIASGDMEQLAQIVLNGDGQKLLNVKAKEPEIQAFLRNVPNYMDKIRRVHEAARGGSLLNLQQALDRRKFAIAKDEISPNGATPLHVAVLFGHSDIVRYLSARFPETTSVTDNDGRTALHYAAVISDNGHFYNVLQQLGANPKAMDNFDKTPEQYLADNDMKDTFNYGLLLKNFGAEELEEQLLSDQVPDDLHSSRRLLNDGDIQRTLDRCFSVIQESSKVWSGATASALAQKKPLSDNNSLQLAVTGYLSRFLKPSVYEKIKKRQTRLDHNLFDVLWPALRKTSKERHLEEDINCGVIAPDFDVYVVFQEFMVPLIKDMHCMSVTADFKPHPRIAYFPMQNAERLNTAYFVFEDDSNLVVRCQVECSRNLDTFELPLNLTIGQIEQAERLMMAKIFSSAFIEAIDEEEPGSYYTLTEILEENSEVHEMLSSYNLLIPLLDQKDAVQQAESIAFNGPLWPYGRGVYVSASNNMALWLNCQEHLRIISSTSSKDAADIGSVYTRIGRCISFLEQQLHFKESYLLGYLQSRPSFLGTGLKMTTIIRLPNLMKEMDNLRHLCSVRGLALTTNRQSKLSVRLINMQSMGSVEHILFQDYCTAVTNILSLEKDMSLTNSKHIASMLVKIFRRKIENQSFEENPIFKTEQGKYLAENLADPLIKALTQVAQKRPQDPLQYLTNYLQTFVAQRNTNGRTVVRAAVHSGSSHTDSTALAANSQTDSLEEKPIVPTSRMNGHVTRDKGEDIETDPAQQQIYDEDADEAEAALSKRLEERDEHGQSMLHFASARSHRRGGLLQLIEESKVDITYRDELYRTARDVALQANQVVNAKDIDRYLISLAIVGDVKPFEYFAIAGYDHIIDLMEDDKSIIEVAESKGHTELATYLRTIRPMEELREELHQMIRDHKADRVKEIVAGPEAKWLLMARNYYGRTALHIAILKEDEELVEHFVKICPEALKIGDNLERSPLHYAMGTNLVEGISRILIQNGAKRTNKDLKGRQPSYYFMNKADILRLQEEEDENR
ncbi:uncharacterized protein LOC101893623 isoform X3 [Musca domestica]|uniref:Uncharacterized protein LOC101893623 isoform X3 n=1 Tax=Musca domestica TaxID=7370 RepID=A0ABM3UR17_MUSDO|nr:uncharacterized protein LOC101893623 isoform X3 [Musca domestica]